MEQFNLDTWLQDKIQKVVTREGRPVRIVCWDSPNKVFPIVGFVDNEPEIFAWDCFGYCREGHIENENDLFFVDEEENLSEDERIRKGLIEHLKELKEQSVEGSYLKRPEHYDAWITWLEKQGETEDEDDTDFTIYHPLKNGSGKYECIPYSFYGSLTSFSEDKDLINFLRNCFYTEKECKEWIEKQDEQKPAEWSEEDERMCQETIDWFEKKCFPHALESENPARESIKWLKSLKDRVQPQPKQEWSEEDEKIMKRIDSLLYSQCTIHGSEYESIHNWLKSLKPQNRWKPSKEQMEALDKAKNCPANYYDIRLGLQSLYNDLLKL